MLCLCFLIFFLCHPDFSHYLCRCVKLIDILSGLSTVMLTPCDGLFLLPSRPRVSEPVSLWVIRRCHDIAAAISKLRMLSGDVFSFTQRDVQPFSVSPRRRFRQCVKLKQLCSKKKFQSVGL